MFLVLLSNIRQSFKIMIFKSLICEFRGHILKNHFAFTFFPCSLAVTVEIFYNFSFLSLCLNPETHNLVFEKLVSWSKSWTPEGCLNTGGASKLFQRVTW